MKNIENLSNAYKILNIYNATKNLKFLKVSIKYLSNITEKLDKDSKLYSFINPYKSNFKLKMNQKIKNLD